MSYTLYEPWMLLLCIGFRTPTYLIALLQLLIGIKNVCMIHLWVMMWYANTCFVIIHHVYMPIFLYLHVFVCMYLYEHVRVCMFSYVSAPFYTYSHVIAWFLRIYVCLCTFLHVLIRFCMFLILLCTISACIVPTCLKMQNSCLHYLRIFLYGFFSIHYQDFTCFRIVMVVYL